MWRHRGQSLFQVSDNTFTFWSVLENQFNMITADDKMSNIDPESN